LLKELRKVGEYLLELEWVWKLPKELLKVLE
jgi:hypothetical protein